MVAAQKLLWAAPRSNCETLRDCKPNKSAEPEPLQQWRRTLSVVPAVSSGLWSEGIILQSHGSDAATRLQTDSVLYLLRLWGFGRLLKRCRTRRRQPLIRGRCWTQRPSHAMERFLPMLRRKQTKKKRSRNPQSKKSKGTCGDAKTKDHGERCLAESAALDAASQPVPRQPISRFLPFTPGLFLLCIPQRQGPRLVFIISDSP